MEGVQVATGTEQSLCVQPTCMASLPRLLLGLATKVFLFALVATLERTLRKLACRLFKFGHSGRRPAAWETPLGRCFTSPQVPLCTLQTLRTYAGALSTTSDAGNVADCKALCAPSFVWSCEVLSQAVPGPTYLVPRPFFSHHAYFLDTFSPACLQYNKVGRLFLFCSNIQIILGRRIGRQGDR